MPAPPPSSLQVTALAQLEYLLCTLCEVPLDSILIFRSTAEVYLRLLETLGYPTRDTKRMVLGIFAAADRYIQDLARDSQALSLKMATAPHSA